VLKKAGIVVAAAAAGLLAVSPLAFAGEMGDHGDHGHHHKAPSYSKHDDHSVKSDRSVKYDHSPSCNAAPQTVGNNNPQTANGVTSPLLGLIGVAANVAAPVTAQLQTPILSCNNLEDIANVTVSDNFQDNSTNVDRSRNTARDSFNG
jgi:hypothetical protein